MIAGSALKVTRCLSIDDFRNALQPVESDLVPLSMADFAPVQAELTLPGCSVYLLKAFPRILDAVLAPERALILFTMEDSAAAIFNGVELNVPLVGLLRGRAAYKVIERAAEFNAAISFPSPMRNRGWPAVEDGLHLARLPAVNLQRLRGLVVRLFVAVSGMTARDLASDIALGCQESLLAALDEAFMSSEPLRVDRARSYRSHLKIVEAIDAAFHANPAAPVYSGALADDIGVSVRTLHNAVTRFRGVSLHHYLRTKRLWMVRQRLLTGEPSLQVKSAAQAFGFWHLGEFAAAYGALFGEVPSQTLARATSDAI